MKRKDPWRECLNELREREVRAVGLWWKIHAYKAAITIIEKHMPNPKQKKRGGKG